MSFQPTLSYIFRYFFFLFEQLLLLFSTNLQYKTKWRTSIDKCSFSRRHTHIHPPTQPHPQPHTHTHTLQREPIGWPPSSAICVESEGVSKGRKLLYGTTCVYIIKLLSNQIHPSLVVVIYVHVYMDVTLKKWSSFSTLLQSQLFGDKWCWPDSNLTYFIMYQSNVYIQEAAENTPTPTKEN